jgi:hypothetical protein
MRGSSAASGDNYIMRQQYSRYPSWPASQLESKMPRSQSSKSVQENPTSPQSAPAASLSRKYSTPLSYEIVNGHRQRYCCLPEMATKRTYLTGEKNHCSPIML